MSCDDLKISFVVIGYNIERYITRCIESILRQTYFNIEIIYVDDGSTDRSIKLVKELMSSDDRLFIIAQENKGVYGARKSGVNHAKGDFVIFVDGDDWIDERMAERFIKSAYDNGRIYDIVMCDYYYAHDNSLLNVLNAQQIYDNIFGDRYLKLILEEKIRHNLCMRLIKRDFLLQSGFSSIKEFSMGEDLAANIFIGLSNPDVKMISDPLYYYYQDSVSISRGSNKILEIVDVMEYIQNILIQASILESYKEQLDFLWFFHVYFYYIIRKNNNSIKNKKILYKYWKKRGIKWKKNILCLEMVKKLTIKKRILISVFDISFTLGCLMNERREL